MVDRDTALAILQSGIALAGLLLIFSGFLFSKADAYQTKRGDRFRLLAKLTLAPVLLALILSWLSVDALQSPSWAAANLLICFRVLVIGTGVFAAIGILLGAP